jgi:hypothetical protein
MDKNASNSQEPKQDPKAMYRRLFRRKRVRKKKKEHIDKEDTGNNKKERKRASDVVQVLPARAVRLLREPNRNDGEAESVCLII